jgi:hypothetical protein
LNGLAGVDGGACSAIETRRSEAAVNSSLSAAASGDADLGEIGVGGWTFGLAGGIGIGAGLDIWLWVLWLKLVLNLKSRMGLKGGVPGCCWRTRANGGKAPRVFNISAAVKLWSASGTTRERDGR